MSFFINLDPTLEEIEATYEKYLKQEETHPEVSTPKNKLSKFLLFRVVGLLLAALPALVMQILRIPFVFIRRFRIYMLKKKSKRLYIKNNPDDPYFMEKTAFEKSKYSQARAEKTAQLQQEYLEKANELREEWHNHPEDLNILLDYTTHKSASIGFEGHKLGIYILDQIQALPKKENLKYDLLHWNLSVSLYHLRIKKQSEHHRNIAFKNGYESPKEVENDSKNLLSAFLFLINHSWKSLHQQIANCWPSLKKDTA